MERLGTQMTSIHWLARMYPNWKFSGISIGCSTSELSSLLFTGVTSTEIMHIFKNSLVIVKEDESSQFKRMKKNPLVSKGLSFPYNSYKHLFIKDDFAWIFCKRHRLFFFPNVKHLKVSEILRCMPRVPPVNLSLSNPSKHTGTTLEYMR